MSPSRSAMMCSTPSTLVALRPRVRIVTSCPRARAYFTVLGPMKPVPPRIRSFLGATDGVGSRRSPGFAFARAPDAEAIEGERASPAPASAAV
jgi:hypothetical protein